MTQHTDGPWTVSASDPLDGSRVVHIGTASAAVVQYENAEANARLIAAAPELLAALKAVNSEFYPIGDALTDTAKLVRAAIAKAEGSDNG